MGETDAEGRFLALRHPSFLRLWLASSFSGMGTWAHVVAQGWLMYQLTDSPLWLGYIGLMRAVPLLVFPLIGGLVADRMSRVKVLYVTQSIAMAGAGILAAVAASGTIAPWHVLCFALLTALLQAFEGPARQAILPDLVPENAIVSAVSLNSWSFNMSMLLGPAVAGLLLPLVGFAGVFLVNAVSFGAVLAVLPFLNVAEGKYPGGAKKNIAEGLRYVLNAPVILPLVALTAIVSLLGRSYAHLMPVLARDLLGLDASGMSWLYTIAGLGAVCMAVVLAAARNLPGKGKMAIGGALGVATFLVIFASSRTLLVSEIALFFMGASLALFSTSTTSTLQLLTPKELRGRVMSVNQIAWQGLEYLGVLFTGALATAASVSPVLIAAGILVAIAALMAVRLRPEISAVA